MTPAIDCTRCGLIVPEHVETEQRAGRSIRECPHCHYPVRITEAIL